MKKTPPELDLRAALLLVLDQVDYMHRACSLTDAIGAALPADVIDIARAALARSTADIETALSLLEQLAERGKLPDTYRTRLIALCERIT